MGEWKTHAGGERPVLAGTVVDVKFRDGEISKGVRAKLWSWEHKGQNDDIVEYRVFEEAK